MAKKRKSKKGKSSRKKGGKDKGNWGKHMLGEDFYGNVPTAATSVAGAGLGAKGGANLYAHLMKQYPNSAPHLTKLGKEGFSVLGGVLGHEAARRFSKPFFKGEDKQAENFRPAIARFIKCLNEKNYAEANKYLRHILEGKLKQRMSDIGNKYS